MKSHFQITLSTLTSAEINHSTVLNSVEQSSKNFYLVATIIFINVKILITNAKIANVSHTKKILKLMSASKNCF